MASFWFGDRLLGVHAGLVRPREERFMPRFNFLPRGVGAIFDPVRGSGRLLLVNDCRRRPPIWRPPRWHHDVVSEQSGRDLGRTRPARCVSGTGRLWPRACRSAAQRMDRGRRFFASAYARDGGGIGQIAEPHGEAGEKGRVTRVGSRRQLRRTKRRLVGISALVFIQPRNLGSSFIPRGAGPRQENRSWPKPKPAFLSG